MQRKNKKVGDRKDSVDRSQLTPAWRQFNFFRSHPLHSSTDLALPPQLLSQPQSISTIVSGFGSTILAHLDGRISLLDHSFDSIRSWSAFPGGRTHLIKPTSINGLLISIGEESGDSLPILKIWNLRHEDKQSSAPQLLGFSKIQNGNRPYPVTALALSPNLSYLALGLADGTVLLFRHLDQALVSAASITHLNRPPPPLPKPKIVFTSAEPITGLGFRTPKTSTTQQSYFSGPDSSTADPKQSSAQRHTCLFIITTAKVLCFFTSARAGAGPEPIVMDDLGGSIGCSELMENGDLILADDSALYVYGPEGRGACLAYEGEKARLYGWANYLVITSPPKSTSAKNDSELTRVIVFDLQNRFIAHSSSFRGTVAHIWAEWGELYILTSFAEVTRLVEKPLAEKLLILYEKDMYVLATNVAKSSGAGTSELSEIYKRFGDYLYQKSDFEGAVQQYIKTIGTVQPSTVVRKFLDAQRISNLTSYLQELHSLGVANADHTTLLLNCYTKLKDHTKLHDFIKANERSARDNEDQLPFDLETAIRVCRQAGYFEPALYLAKQYHQDEEYLRIQVEDRGEWLDAVRFMRSLGQVGAEENLLRYGKPLLANLPEETTDLMIDVCSGVKLDPLESSVDSPAPSTNKVRTSITRPHPSPRPSSAATPTQKNSQLANTPTGPGGAEAEKSTSTGLPSIREFFAFFIDQPQCFIRFLETIALRRWREKLWDDDDDDDEKSDRQLPESYAQVALPHKEIDQTDLKPGSVALDNSNEEDREAVWGTLLELYLQMATEVDEKRVRMKKRALSLLRKGASGEKLRYEPTQALIVCLTHDFVPGIMLLYDRLGMVEDILRFWIERTEEVEDMKEVEESRLEIFKNLKKYGDDHPELYPIALRYLASSGHQYLTAELNDSPGKSLNELEASAGTGVGGGGGDVSPSVPPMSSCLENVLMEIEQRKILSPIEVIEILSKPGSCASIGTVKKYLLNQVLNHQSQMNSDFELIKSYRKESSKKRMELNELVSKPKIFNLNDKCSSCFSTLDLPVIHFMCQHSYHSRCIGDQEYCMRCTNESKDKNNDHESNHHQEAMKEMMNLIKRNKTYLLNTPPHLPTNSDLAISKQIDHLDLDHPFFIDQVLESDDPFGYIASSFSKGIL